MSEVKTFQVAIGERIRTLLGGIEVVSEWRAMTGQEGVYSPRLDLAVGPFAIGSSVYADVYDSLVERYADFMQVLYAASNENFTCFDGRNDLVPYFDVVHRNSNARCFLAVEIENRTSRKHLMGGAINAAALGRIGIAIGWTEEMVRALVKLRAYLMYLSSVGKNMFQPFNLLVLSRKQFANAVNLSD